jgi:hypothetical protein
VFSSQGFSQGHIVFTPRDSSNNLESLCSPFVNRSSPRHALKHRNLPRTARGRRVSIRIYSSAAQKPECTRDKTKVSSDLSTAHIGARNDCSTCVTIFSVPRNKFPETIRLLDILLHTALTSTLPLKPHAQNNISVTLSDTMHKRLLFSWMVLLRTCFYVHIVQKSAK